MASVITDTSTLKVVLLEEGNREQTVNIDAPLSNMNLTKIKNAFSGGISNNLIIGPYGSYIVAVTRATKEDKVTQKYESDGIYYTVNPVTLTGNITQIGSNNLGSFVISGAIPETFNISSTDISGNLNVIYDFLPIITRETNKVTIQVTVVTHRTTNETGQVLATKNFKVFFNDTTNGRYTEIAVTAEVNIPTGS